MFKHLWNAIRPAKIAQVAPEAPVATPVATEAELTTAQQLRELRGDLAQLQMEWAETLDKLNAWASRQATRDRRAFGKKLEVDPEVADAALAMEAAEPTLSVTTPTKADLYRRLNALRRNA